MTAKEYLNQAKVLDKEITSKLRMLNSYKDMLYSVSTAGLEKRYGRRKNSEPNFVECVSRINELEQEINSLIDKLTAVIADIDKKILECVGDEFQQSVLRCFYTCFMTMEQIADRMYYSLSWVNRNLWLGVKTFTKNFNSD